MAAMSKLKICGITSATFAVEAAKRGVDFLGFIFASASPRRVTLEQAKEIIAAVRTAKTVDPPRFVGVFVEQSVEEIACIAADVGLDVIQLHGGYGAGSIAPLKSMGYAVWRLLADDPADEDAILLDGSDGQRRGGTGLRADWSAVPKLKSANRRVILAGGISAANISAAAATGADVIDVNSSIETSPGEKSLSLLDGLLTAYRNQCLTA